MGYRFGTDKRAPGLLIDRDAFLREALGKKLTAEQLKKLVEEGGYSSVSLDVLDSAANSYISKTRLITSSASFLAGLPSSLPALPVTITADVTQSFAFYIRVAQQLAYIYGEKSDFTQMHDDDRMTKLLLYIGSMFGVEAASQVLIIMSKNAGEMLAKKFGQTAVTKVLNGVPWKVAKIVAKLLGVKLTKEVAQKGISKVIPILGGIVSGALTYSTFGPMAKKLQESLRSTLQASDAEVLETHEVFLEENDADIVLSVNEDIIGVEEEAFDGEQSIEGQSVN